MSLVDDLTRDEGYRAAPYKDSLGILTIGCGRNLEANPLTGAEWKALLDANEMMVSISKAGANRLLESGIQAAQVKCAGTFIWWPKLNTVRQDVLTNMVFNIGMARLSCFSKMLAAIARESFDEAADELLDSLYAKQVGVRAQRLSLLLRTGVRV